MNLPNLLRQVAMGHHNRADPRDLRADVVRHYEADTSTPPPSRRSG
jgi:hypothetical protein